MLFFMLITSFLILGCSKTIEFKDQISHVEYGDIINDKCIKEMIKNPELLPKKYSIKIDGQKIEEGKAYDIGNYILTLEYVGGSLNHNIEISDTKAPIITQKKTDIEIDPEIDLKSLFTVEDESAVEYCVESNKDFFKTGTYNISVEAKDSEGNVAYKEFSVEISDSRTVDKLRLSIQENKQQIEDLKEEKEQLKKTYENLSNPDYASLYARGRYHVTQDGDQVFIFPKTEEEEEKTKY